MSGARAQPAEVVHGAGVLRERTPLMHLLHALNQPLTGLHCSLELALAAPRRPEQYVHTLRESLDLSSRMRILLEALRELADQKASRSDEISDVLFDDIVVEITRDLEPVAQEKGVEMKIDGKLALAARADRNQIERICFRLLESALALCRENSELKVSTGSERKAISVTVSWVPGVVPEYSPLSRSELGLLLAQSEWEAAGGSWNLIRHEDSQACILSLPLTNPSDIPEEI